MSTWSRELRAEALPPLHDANLGRGSIRQSQHGNPFRPRRAGGRPRQPGLARPGDFRGGGRRRLARRHQLRPRLGPESCPAAPDRDRTGSEETVREGWDYPDTIFAPCGGGSNFGGAALPFFADKAAGKSVRLVAVEPASCPTLTRGHYAYDFGDTAKLTPMMLMYTLGHDFMPPGIHAGGLRYHGDSALVSQLYHEKLIEAIAVPQLATFEAGVTFARAEGIIPAPESNHAIAACIDEALRCKGSGEAKTLFFNLSGHGHFDMAAYDSYFSGKLEDFAYPEEAIRAALERLPKVG
ncbi:pyridoxal-phosphate dependent enzyme [Thiobacillus sp.]